MKEYDIRDIYMKYPYKKTDPRYTRPYVPLSQSTDHKYTLSYKQYMALYLIYIKYVKYYLLCSLNIKLPQFFGELQLYKYKYTTRFKTDLSQTHYGGKPSKFKNDHTFGYGPLVKWLTADNGRFWYKSKWKMGITKTFRNELGIYYKKSFKDILSYPEIKTGKAKIIRL